MHQTSNRQATNQRLINKFNHKSSKVSDYNSNNYNTVIREITSGYPIILSGGRKSKGLLPFYKNGHAWVCDGYKESKICRENGLFYGVLFLHMNWGWESSSKNGWYGFQNWTVSGQGSYNYMPKMVYNIRP